MMTAQDEISRFVSFYDDELSRTGFKPDASSTRDTRIAFLQQTVKRFCSPLLAMKRADPTRPISDEVVVFVQAGAEYRKFADFLISGGSANWQLSDHIEGFLPASQPLVNPLTLAFLPDGVLAPTVPGCTGPTPGPGPEPPPVVQPYPSESPDGGWWGQVADVQIAATYARKGIPYPSDQKSLRWVGRISYDIRDGMTKEASLAKHIKELEQELGL